MEKKYNVDITPIDTKVEVCSRRGVGTGEWVGVPNDIDVVYNKPKEVGQIRKGMDMKKQLKSIDLTGKRVIAGPKIKNIRVEKRTARIVEK